MTTTQTSSIHDVLRTKTAQAHRNIEKTHAMRTLMSSQVTVADYALVLTCWSTWFKANEIALVELLGDFAPTDIALRAKLGHIEQDLTHPFFNALTPPLIDSNTLLMANKFEALGVLYVIEGATLGSKIIVKRLRKTLPSELTHHFYAGYEDQTHAMWAKFIHYLNHCELSPQALNYVAKGAIATFNNLSDMFSQPIFNQPVFMNEK